MSQIKKQYPATVHRGATKVELSNKKSDINQLVLYNKNIDALIYTYFLDNSYPVENDNGQMQTRVWKSEIPSQDKIAEACRMSKSTYCRKLKILKDEGYIIDFDEYYLVKNPQTSFIHIPLQTIKFFVDACNSNVIKTYLYLAQGNKLAKKNGQPYYNFTREQIMRVIKLSPTNKESRTTMTNILDCLENNGLIKIQDGFRGQKPIKKLIQFNLTYKKNN